MCKLSEFKFSTTNIKGKEYIEVNQRVDAFRVCDEFKGFSLETEVVNYSEESVLFKAIVKDATGRIISTGYAKEDRDSSNVNATSYIENAETSAVGRALGFLGIGIKTSIASANEVNTAIKQQEKMVQNNTNKPTQQQISANVNGIIYLYKVNRGTNQQYWMRQDGFNGDPNYPLYANERTPELFDYLKSQL